MVLPAELFSPKSSGGPSGMADKPRPFVLRAAHLDGCTFHAGEEFYFDLHLFDLRAEVRAAFPSACAQWGKPAELSGVEEAMEVIDLGDAGTASQVRIEFVTPTELKSEGRSDARPEFAILFARVRDRVSTLRACYGDGPLPIDFQALGERAARVRMTADDLRWEHSERRSSRTGQTHPLGGFTGWAAYEGEVGEFLPYLRAAEYTGVGRQTVWGKGQIRLVNTV